MGELLDAFNKKAKESREKEEVFEVEEPELLVVKVTNKDGSTKEVKEVSEDYELESNEEFTTKEEYIKDQNKKSVELGEKVIADGKQIRKNQLRNLLINNYVSNVELFYEEHQFFTDDSGIFWFWKGNKYVQTNDTDIMNLLDDELGFMGQTVNSKLKSNYMESFRRVGRKHIPKDAPTKWVQFNNIAFSIESKNMYDVKPNYFFTNPIPWEIGKSEDTPIIDKLFVDWVGEENKKTLYELVAYCCYTDYPIQLLFCLVGSGRNGKGCFLKILDKFLGGDDNVRSTSLDLISGNNKNRI